MDNSHRELGKVYRYDVVKATGEVRREPGYWLRIVMGGFFFFSWLVGLVGGAVGLLVVNQVITYHDAAALCLLGFFMYCGGHLIYRYGIALPDLLQRTTFQVTGEALIFQSPDRTIRVPWDSITEIRALRHRSGSYIIKHRGGILGISSSVLDREALAAAVKIRAPNASYGTEGEGRLHLFRVWLGIILGWILLVVSAAVAVAGFAFIAARMFVLLKH